MNILIAALPVQLVLCAVWAVPLALSQVLYLKRYADPGRYPGWLAIFAVNLPAAAMSGILVMDLHWVLQTSLAGVVESGSPVSQILHLTVITIGTTLPAAMFYHFSGWFKIDIARIIRLLIINFIALGVPPAIIQIVELIQKG